MGQTQSFYYEHHTSHNVQTKETCTMRHSRVWDSSPPISVVLGGMSILCFIHYSSVHNNINIQMTYQSAFGEGWRERTLSELQLEGVCRTEWGKPGTISERWFSSIIYIAGGLLSWPRFISKRIAAHTEIPEGINTYRCKTQRLVCSGPYGSIHQINSYYAEVLCVTFQS